MARGGLRWSNRPHDFRKEVLGLVKTQQAKNVVIVPVGSKGGFVIKSTSENQVSEAKVQYKKFIGSLLDITDSVDEKSQIIHPNKVIRYDGSDPYLVVAADKGTAEFSDLANDVSKTYKFWLDDAFASGGSVGYNHKDAGITAKGAWECVKLHFKELGLDIQKEPFTVAGIGDMSGDVFGNGMLLSKSIKLVAAFNHQHIFLDPTPDQKKGWKERKRLFDTPRSQWTDYSLDVISKGGGIFNRKAKEIKLSPEIRELFGIKATVLNGEQVIRAILHMKVDLIWFGGIGTYIKSSQEPNISVGDPANDAVRIDAANCKAQVIGEGANLGLTQNARIEVAKKGVSLNTDAVDNSAGVNMSDLEVNIKILLKRLLQDNVLPSLKSRNTLLKDMTNEVSELCLINNREQHRLISMDSLRSKGQANTFVRMIQFLENKGLLNLKSEHIPDLSEFEELAHTNRPIPRPILAILQAYSKMWVFEQLSDSTLLDDPSLYSQFESYFPSKLIKKHSTFLSTHHLKREILCTLLTNKIVNRAGATFFYQLHQISGRSVSDIAKAYLIVNEGLKGDDFRENLLREPCSEDNRYLALLDYETTIHTLTLDVLQNPNIPLNFELSSDLRSVFLEIHERCGGKKVSAQGTGYWTRKNISPECADTLYCLTYLGMSIDVLYINKQYKLDIGTAIKLALKLDQLFGFDWLRSKIKSLRPKTHWEVSQIDILSQSMHFQKINLIHYLLKNPETKEAAELNDSQLLKSIRRQYDAQLGVYFDHLKQLKSGGSISLTSLTVTINRLNFLSI